MANEAVIRLRLDTKAAERDLGRVAQKGRAAAGRVDKSVRGGGSGAGSAGGGRSGGGKSFGKGLGLGAGVAAGIGLVKSAASSGISEVINEKISGTVAEFEGRIGVPQARADKGAREDSKNAFAELVSRGLVGVQSPEISSFHNQSRALRLKTEMGANRIDAALGGRATEEAKLLVDQLVGAVKEGFQDLIETIGIKSAK